MKWNSLLKSNALMALLSTTERKAICSILRLSRGHNPFLVPILLMWFILSLSLSQNFSSTLRWESGFTSIPQLEKVENNIWLKLSDRRTGVNNLHFMGWMWPIIQSHPAHNPNKKYAHLNHERGGESNYLFSCSRKPSPHPWVWSHYDFTSHLSSNGATHPLPGPVRMNCEPEKGRGNGDSGMASDPNQGKVATPVL